MFKDVKNDYNRFSLKELQKRREVCKFTSERQELIQKFVDKINSQRDSKALKKCEANHCGQLDYIKKNI